MIPEDRRPSLTLLEKEKGYVKLKIYISQAVVINTESNVLHIPQPNSCMLRG
jgi:hypothetical protein